MNTVKTSVLAALALAASAHAGTVVAWSIPSAVNSSVQSGTYDLGAADIGPSAAGSMLRGVHAEDGTTWSSPSGNGSAHSFTANSWTVGDYFEVSFSATGFSGLSVAWDQAQSGFAAWNFQLQMSVDGGAFSTLISSYAVELSNPGGAMYWNTGFAIPSFYSHSQSLGAAADGASNVTLRFVSLATKTASMTSSIDDIVVSGNSVPAPGAVALLSVAGLLSGARRRR